MKLNSLLAGLVERTEMLNQRYIDLEDENVKLKVRISDYEAEAENQLPKRRR